MIFLFVYWVFFVEDFFENIFGYIMVCICSWGVLYDKEKWYLDVGYKNWFDLMFFVINKIICVCLRNICNCFVLFLGFMISVLFLILIVLIILLIVIVVNLNMNMKLKRN